MGSWLMVGPWYWLSGGVDVDVTRAGGPIYEAESAHFKIICEKIVTIFLFYTRVFSF
jgi:hypothetical protein